MKVISFTVPCYNSASYMDACIESIISCGDDIEIIIVDDGSTDSTLLKANQWHDRSPEIVRVVHQENGGHGSAVNTGLANSSGLYFKVVDSDDWLDVDAMKKVMSCLRSQASDENRFDLIIANYVYDKVSENKRTVMRYDNVFPVERRFSWSDIGKFKLSQYLLMHSVIYRTDLLKQIELILPEHCFYVDNIFVYVPLAHVKSIYYIDANMYHYFIGRQDQSVNQEVMMGRIDQQLTVTKIMIDSVDLPSEEIDQKLQKYLCNYLSMMLCICSVFLRMINDDNSIEKLKNIWRYLYSKNSALYRVVRYNILNIATNIPSAFGRAIALGCYHLAQKIFKFN